MGLTGFSGGRMLKSTSPSCNLDLSPTRRGGRIRPGPMPRLAAAMPASLMTAARYGAALSKRARTLAIRMGYHSRPSFLIIGAQKAGTTALHGYLAEHPAIVPAQDKELAFFSPELFSDWPEHPNHAILC